jgi:cell wall-associated NlpC family hydrolase
MTLVSQLLLAALSASPGDAAPACPPGFICIEARCPSGGRSSCEPAGHPACAHAWDEAAQAVPAVAHREAPEPAPTVVPAAASVPAPSSSPAAAVARAERRSGFSRWAIGGEAGLNFGGTLSVDIDPGAAVSHDTEAAPAFPSSDVE